MTQARAVILHNEIAPDSPEDILDVSVQADWVSDILNELGYKTVNLPFSLDCIEELARHKENGPFFVVNLVDSAPGEDNLVYLVPSILDALKIPYTGCSAQALFLTTDKVLTKKVLQSYGLPTPIWVSKHDDYFVPNERYIIKPQYEDASIGLDNDSVVFAETRDDLTLSIAERVANEGRAFFAERYIEGREFTVCAYGRRNDPIVLPPYEWIFPGFDGAGIPRIINYDAKWTEHTYEYDSLKAVYRLPDEDAGLIDELAGLSKTCYEKFDLSGYARIDFRIDDRGKPWILEINSNPSFYGFYNVAKAYGLEFSEVIKTIVESI